jgi:hypothetical protein
MQLLLLKDQYVVQTLSPNTPQKAFTDRISSWRMIRRFQYLDTAGCCHSSETRSKLAIMIGNKVLRRLSIQCSFSELLRDPRIGRRLCHAYVDHFCDLSSIQYSLL